MLQLSINRKLTVCLQTSLLQGCSLCLELLGLKTVLRSLLEPLHLENFQFPGEPVHLLTSTIHVFIHC